MADKGATKRSTRVDHHNANQMFSSLISGTTYLNSVSQLRVFFSTPDRRTPRPMIYYPTTPSPSVGIPYLAPP